MPETKKWRSFYIAVLVANLVYAIVFYIISVVYGS